MRKRRLLYIVCLLGVFWLNVIYVEYQFFLLLVLLIVVPAISGVLFELAANGLKLYLNIPQKEVHPGQLVTVCIKAVNRHVIFLGKQQFQIGVAYLNTPGNEKEMLQCDGVTEKVQQTMAEFSPKHCGIAQIDIEKVFLQDYLGLIGTQKNFRGSCQLAVLPEPVLSTRVRTGMEKQQEYRYSAVADDDSDILDLRAFRPGDNLKHIHWNLSLRTDDLIVRQYGEQIDVKKVILVDLSILNTAQYRSRMDAVYTAVASIANLYVENEVNTLILAWNGQKQSAEYLEVHDRTELNRAMIRLMQIPCSSRAGEHAAAVYLKDIEAQGQQALFVTAGSYENNKVRIVNVEKIQLQELIDELWEKI